MHAAVLMSWGGCLAVTHERARDGAGVLKDRQRLAGALAWVLIMQFFVMHLVVQSRWPRPYSWRRNWISDLGKAQCEASSGAGVTKAWACSPWHLAMDVSFVLGGFLILIGTLFLGQGFPPGRMAAAARGLLFGVGLGWILVGCSPGDGPGIAPSMHVVGALLAMPVMNLALALLGTAMYRQGRWPGMAALAVALGVLGFVCVWLVTPLEDAGWNGLAQRLATFPQLVWMIAYGGRTLAQHFVSGPHPRAQIRNLGSSLR